MAFEGTCAGRQAPLCRPSPAGSSASYRENEACADGDQGRGEGEAVQRSKNPWFGFRSAVSRRDDPDRNIILRKTASSPNRARCLSSSKPRLRLIGAGRSFRAVAFRLTGVESAVALLQKTGRALASATGVPQGRAPTVDRAFPQEAVDQLQLSCARSPMTPGQLARAPSNRATT